MTTMRKKIAEHMIHSKRTSAHVHSVFEADVSKIVKIREANKKSFEATTWRTKLTYMTFFVKACCDALRKFPWMNSSLDGDEILVHRSVNMGIAVALEGGSHWYPSFRVPMNSTSSDCRSASPTWPIAPATKALLPNEVQGGTFTITNPGQFGGLYGIPIINQPQVAILGLGGIEKRPVVIEGDAIAQFAAWSTCASATTTDWSMAPSPTSSWLSSSTTWRTGTSRSK